jgi:hypothetical protein
MFRRLTILTLALASATALIACSNSSNPSAVVTSVVITGTAPARGQSAQFAATATFSDGTTKDVTTTSTWSSSDLTVASVTAAGLVAGVGDGTATISVTYLTMSTTDAIQVAG